MAFNQEDNLFFMQVRLFRLAQIRWKKEVADCEDIFDKYEVNDYIETCYEEYHVQGDESNLDDIEKYLYNKGAIILKEGNNMKVSKFEYSMELLAMDAAMNLAEEMKISRPKAFFIFMQSETGDMLFDEDTDMWMNGPDYIADEYRREMKAKEK